MAGPKQRPAPEGKSSDGGLGKMSVQHVETLRGRKSTTSTDDDGGGNTQTKSIGEWCNGWRQTPQTEEEAKRVLDQRGIRVAAGDDDDDDDTEDNDDAAAKLILRIQQNTIIWDYISALASLAIQVKEIGGRATAIHPCAYADDIRMHKQRILLLSASGEQQTEDGAAVDVMTRTQQEQNAMNKKTEAKAGKELKTLHAKLTSSNDPNGYSKLCEIIKQKLIDLFAGRTGVAAQKTRKKIEDNDFWEQGRFKKLIKKAALKIACKVTQPFADAEVAGGRKKKMVAGKKKVTKRAKKRVKGKKGKKGGRG